MYSPVVPDTTAITNDRTKRTKKMKKKILSVVCILLFMYCLPSAAFAYSVSRHASVTGNISL